jgi:hypothetical protein
MFLEVYTIYFLRRSMENPSVNSGIASAAAGVPMLTVFCGGGEEQALAVRAVRGPGFAGGSAGQRF